MLSIALLGVTKAFLGVTSEDMVPLRVQRILGKRVQIMLELPKKKHTHENRPKPMVMLRIEKRNFVHPADFVSNRAKRIK